MFCLRIFLLNVRNEEKVIKIAKFANSSFIHQPPNCAFPQNDSPFSTNISVLCVENVIIGFSARVCAFDGYK